MAKPSKLPDAHVLRDLHLVMKMTYEQIAKEYGVSKQAVQFKLSSVGYAPQGRDRYKVIPWDLSPEHTKQRRAQLLRAHMRDMDGEEVSGKLGTELPGFRRRLRDKVLDYRPSEGLVFVDREPRDNGLVLRWPSGVDKPGKGLIHLFMLPSENGE